MTVKSIEGKNNLKVINHVYYKFFIVLCGAYALICHFLLLILSSMRRRMEMRNSENVLNIPFKVKDDILHGSEKLNSTESMFFKCYKSREENVRSTCLIREPENIKVQKERKRLEQFHNMDDDATLNKYRKCDGLEEFIISQQSSVNCGLESTLNDNNTSCQDIEENTKSIHSMNSRTSYQNISIDSDNVSQSLNVINVFCPICNQSIQVQNDRDVNLAVNRHIDICLNNKTISNLSPKPHDSSLIQNNPKFYQSDNKLKNFSNTTSNLPTKTKLSQSNSILNYMVNKS